MTSDKNELIPTSLKLHHFANKIENLLLDKSNLVTTKNLTDGETYYYC
jgi:hypothetical protein